MDISKFLIRLKLVITDWCREKRLQFPVSSVVSLDDLHLHPYASRSIRFFPKFLQATIWIAVAIPVTGTSDPLLSHNYIFERYQPHSDVSFENIYDIEKGKGDCLWFASWGDGIGKIDEGFWRHLSEESESPLPSNFVKSLTYHQAGDHLWAATTKGVVVIDGEEVHAISLPEKFEPTSILILNNESILIGSRMGRVISSQLKALDLLPESNWVTLLEAGNNNAFSVDEILHRDDGSIWVVRNRSGVVRIKDGKIKNFSSQETGVLRANQLLPMSDGSLILSGSGSPSRYHQNKWTLMSYVNPTYRTCQLSDGNLVFGALDGKLLIHRDAHTEVIWSPDNSNIRIRSLIQDDSGRIWIGVKAGIVKGSPRRWVDSGLVKGYEERFVGNACIYSEDYGLIAINDQNELACYDSNGKTWSSKLRLPGAQPFHQRMMMMGGVLRVFSDGTIFEIDAETFQLVNAVPGPTKGFLTGAEPYGEDSMFVSSVEGCFVWENQTWKRLGSDSKAYASCVVPSTETVAIVKENGVELWKSGSMVYRWSEPSRHADTRYHFVEPLGDDSFIAGILGQGLFLLEKGKPFSPMASEGLYSKRCTAALLAACGDLWIGFEGGGVACRRDNRWVNFAFDNGLRNETVVGIIECHAGAICVLTEDFGVYRLNPDQIAPETKMAGAPDRLEVEQLAVFAFEGRDGWDETKQKDLVYSWRILPRTPHTGSKQSTWSEYSQSKSVLIEAPKEAGLYTFEVRAQDRGFNTDKTPATHYFEVRPPFWKTTAFMLPMLGMTSIASLLALKVIKNHFKLKQHRDELDLRVQERTSELQLISEKLQLEKERFEATIHSSADAIVVIDDEDKITLFNQAASSLACKGQQPVKGRRFQEVYDLSVKLSYQSLSELIANTLTQNLSGIVKAKTSNGNEIEFEYSAGAMRSESRVLGFVLAFRDRSPMKELENERQRRSNLESLGVVAGGIAHDFNNFLTAILGNISVVEKICPDDLKMKKALEQSRLASINAKSLTKQLLTFAKGGSPILEHTNLSELIRSSAEFCARGTTYHCQFDMDPNLSMVEVDSGQMTHVIHNLVLNAMQSMGEGGIVRITASNAMADSRCEQQDHKGEANKKIVRFTIADSGEGIPEDKIDKIFDPYFTSKPQGSGLGLAVCHSIIEQHKGTIVIKSKPGHGTIVTIELPVPKNEILILPKKEKERKRYDQPKKERLRVLVMDDNPSILDMLNQFLEILGHEDVGVKNGELALQEIRSSLQGPNPIDACILDLTIPGSMGGVEVAKTIKNEGLGVYTIASSGYSENEIRSEHNDTVFDDFLHKPYTMEELQKCLSNICETRC